MAILGLRYDFRAPADLKANAVTLMREGLAQIQWADALGFARVELNEHHGSPDGYLPSPAVMMGACAAVTQRIRLRGFATLPLLDPVRVAEDFAVADVASNGRVEMAAIAGYVPSEFRMFGAALSERGRRMDESIVALRRAWSGETFLYQGREVCVTPRPVQASIPIYVGGGTPAAARRAARLGDGFLPMTPQSYQWYEEECQRLGKTPFHPASRGPSFLHVSEQPERDWALIAPHALYETNCYARWQSETGVTGIYQPITDADALRQSGLYQVMTPEACIAFINSLEGEPELSLQPLMGGLSPDMGWQSLRLFAEKVMPYLR